MKKIRVAILSITLLSLLTGYGFRLTLSQKADERTALKEIAPEADFSEKGGSPPHYRSRSGMIAFNSWDVAPGIRGYAGPLHVLLVLDRDARITGIKLLEHRETKNYVHYMETKAYLAGFTGKRMTDAFEVDRDLDAITRATVSVEALAKTVKQSSRTIAATVLGMDVQTDDRSAPKADAAVWYLLLFALSLTAYFITRRSPRFHRFRDASLAAGIVIIGLYLSSPFSILHVFNLLQLQPSSALLWYALVVSTLLSVIMAGRFYCGWLCPFGALSEFLGRLPFRKWVVPAELDGKGRKLKYVLLGLITMLALITGKADYGNYETYVTLFSFHGNLFSWSLVAVTLLANIRVERFWCRYLCPVAALTGLLSHRAEEYSGGSDCPMANPARPAQSECIRCNRCLRRGAVTEVKPR